MSQNLNLPREVVSDTIKGNDTVKIGLVVVSEKGLIAYKKFYPEGERGDIIRSFKDTEVRRLSDNSPYYICVYEDVRFVWVRTKGDVVEKGHFTLIEVQHKRPG